MGISRHPHRPGPCRTLPPEAGLRRPLPARRPEAGMLCGSGRPGLRGSAASSRCARPSASAPAPPTLVCSRPRPCGSAGARPRLQRGERGWGRLHAPDPQRGVRSRLPRPGRRCAGSPGGGRSPTAQEGRGGTGGGCWGGKEPLQRRPAADVEEVDPGSAFSRGSVVIPASPSPCRVGLTGHRPQLHLRPGLHFWMLFFCGGCRGVRAGEEVGGEWERTPHLGWMKDSGRWVFMQSLPPPGRASLPVYSRSRAL